MIFCCMALPTFRHALFPPLYWQLRLLTFCSLRFCVVWQLVHKTEALSISIFLHAFACLQQCTFWGVPSGSNQDWIAKCIFLGSHRVYSFREKSFWGIQGAIGSSGPCKYSFLRVCSTMTCLSHGCAPHNPAYIFDRCIASLLFSKFLVKFFLILILAMFFRTVQVSPLTSVDSFLFRKTSFLMTRFFFSFFFRKKCTFFLSAFF